MKIQADRIRGEIVARGFKQKDLAKALGITAHAFQHRLKTGRFNSDQLYTIAKMLKLENPWQIFFADDIT